MKEEDYYTILQVAEKANPSGMIEHAPPDQAEDDDPIQPPEDAADSIEEFFYGWEDPQPEAPIPQLRRSSRTPNQRKDIAALLEIHHIYQTQLQMQRKPPAHQQRYLVAESHCPTSTVIKRTGPLEISNGRRI